MWTQPQLPPEPPRPGHSKPRPGQRVRVAERVCGAVGLRPLPRHYPPQHRLREPGRQRGGGGRTSRDGGAAHQHPVLAQAVRHSSRGEGEGEQVIRSVGNSQPASSFMFMQYSVKLKSNCRAVGIGRGIYIRSWQMVFTAHDYFHGANTMHSWWPSAQSPPKPFQR